jgi:hypothetical protein
VSQKARVVIVGRVQAEPGSPLLAPKPLVALAQQARFTESGGGLDDGQAVSARISQPGDQVRAWNQPAAAHGGPQLGANYQGFRQLCAHQPPALFCHKMLAEGQVLRQDIRLPRVFN